MLNAIAVKLIGGTECLSQEHNWKDSVKTTPAKDTELQPSPVYNPLPKLNALVLEALFDNHHVALELYCSDSGGDWVFLADADTGTFVGPPMMGRNLGTIWYDPVVEKFYRLEKILIIR